MPFIFDGPTRTITEQALPGSPIIATYDVLRDLWSAGEIWWGESDNLKYRFPFRQSGGGRRFVDLLGNQVYATADIYLQNQNGMNWRIVPADYHHVIRFSGANLFGEDAGLPIYELNGLSNPVIIEPQFSDIQTSYLVNQGGGGGVTPEQVWGYSGRSLSTAGNQAIADSVWSSSTSGFTGAGTAGKLMADIGDQASNSFDSNDRTTLNDALSEIQSAHSMITTVIAQVATISTQISLIDSSVDTTLIQIGIIQSEINQFSSQFSFTGGGVVIAPQNPANVVSAIIASQLGMQLDDIYTLMGMKAGVSLIADESQQIAGSKRLLVNISSDGMQTTITRSDLP
jgi:hypothetical protein